MGTILEQGPKTQSGKESGQGDVILHWDRQEQGPLSNPHRRLGVLLHPFTPFTPPLSYAQSISLPPLFK